MIPIRLLWTLGTQEFVILAILIVILVFFWQIFKRLLKRK